MSCDMLENVDFDGNGSTVVLTMRASGDAWLAVSGSEVSTDYHLSATEKGLKNAESIALALTNWAAHIKRCGLVRSE